MAFMDAFMIRMTVLQSFYAMSEEHTHGNFDISLSSVVKYPWFETDAATNLSECHLSSAPFICCCCCKGKAERGEAGGEKEEGWQVENMNYELMTPLLFYCFFSPG